FFDPYMRPAMRESVRARAATILQHYADEDGRPRDRAWFDGKLRELSTYWGIDYGHRGRYDELVSIGNSCFHEGDGNRPADGTLLPFELAGTREYPPGSIGLLGQTAPHVGGAKSRTSRAAELASVGASPARRDDFGRTPLHAALLSLSEAAARRLLDAGADPNAADDYGTTPLHLACRRGSVALVRLLLGRGGDPNVRSAAGTTPLHEAASVGDATIVRILLDSGAKADATDERGRTPADVARAHGFPEVAVLLARGGQR
ncbi:MAG TPA: ankyrin repeat domain-containing protein, partial [Tepidisphaeraceae bacterium]|nr:ankyrin repeat domain-containing protein [Tepidisphaeraceae bacterium]